MKRYKLLKDTPTVKAGTIFEEESDSYNGKKLVEVVPDWCLIRPWLAVSDIDNFDEWFEEIKEPKKWRAEYGKKYWYLDDCGVVLSNEEWGDDTDDFRYRIGNYFKTEAEAEAYKEYLLARQVLIDDAEGGKIISDRENWIGIYSEIYEEWNMGYFYGYRPDAFCFKCKDSLQKSLEEHKEQWEIVRKYETKEM